ncbi:HAD family hydrolase [Streptomyces sp. NPDC101209]|uniref:HAD family hydrolase n=1 Tax=Streptomyces sp. NPDC101209 TaxID=3366129 RepID=UPI003808C7DB
MPLLLLDLGNTLVDRDAAFRTAVADFLTEHGLPDSDLIWVMAVDASGYTARYEVAAALSDRYGDVVPTGAVRDLLENGAADRVVLAQSAHEALSKARADGWTCVIVTNGRTAQQEAKIRKTGLDRLVQGWVISEAVGHKKTRTGDLPSGSRCRQRPLSGAWVIGDSLHADIAGANALDLRSVWVTDGRGRPQDAWQPTHIAEDVTSAINHVIYAWG